MLYHIYRNVFCGKNCRMGHFDIGPFHPKGYEPGFTVISNLPCFEKSLKQTTKA